MGNCHIQIDKEIGGKTMDKKELEELVEVINLIQSLSLEKQKELYFMVLGAAWATERSKR